jgi:hypothetical protein
MENLEFLKAMLAEMNTKMDATKKNAMNNGEADTFTSLHIGGCQKNQQR